MTFDGISPEHAARFWQRVDKQAGDGCWIWTGAVNHHRGGYGVATFGRQTFRAHRLAYLLTHGSIPEGLVLDHLCRTTACVRPDHLEPVTQLENTLRGDSSAVTRARHQRRVHCAQGHPFSGDNVYVHPRGERVCRTCQNASAARWRAKKAAEPKQKANT